MAERGCGSITLVTHFFPTRPELMRAVVAEMIENYDTELATLEESADASARLRILMRWMLPLAEDEWAAEEGRVVLIAQRDQEPSIGEFFTTMDARIRELLRRHVEPLGARRAGRRDRRPAAGAGQRAGPDSGGAP
ncbi:TetR/AcrR family transcriptional regulator [Streptomyces pseudovenezuelae]|uniref:AcrR family transcriptional regulator n=1 Tax=Streptomyces pseudovenezuelae TaxID=67350 RepID=A0ABT6LZG1_9ACTN|nr:hypothetical protein [Streptomyces pseudovenezuelae]MDH6221081.1 AcrR family transcriptional regulator [Streptomyces pseudovenezuelae]